MQTSDSTQHYSVASPMVFHPASASTKLTTKPDDRQDDEAVVAITTRLKAVALNQFDQLDQFDPCSMMEAATCEMALTQTTFEECQKQLSDKVLALVKDNGALGQQLVAAESREREANLVHAKQLAAKDAQIASLQQQIAKLIADKEAEVQRLQNMLKGAEKQKTTALATAQATWEQQKAQMNQQNSSLQAQVKSVANQRDSLQAQVNEEPKRQKAAVDATLALVKAKLAARVDVNTQYCEKTIYPIKGYYNGYDYSQYKSSLWDMEHYVKYRLWDELNKK